MKLLCTCLLASVLIAPFDAQQKVSQEAPPQLDELAWLSGTWVNESEKRFVQEVWLEPLGGAMLGLHHDVDLEQDRTRSFEYLRVIQTGEDIYYVASPNGEGTTAFRMVELEPTRVVFANPEHDFPKRIGYRMEGEVLIAWIEGDDHAPQEWRWKRRD
jgi:hypothetical protein